MEEITRMNKVFFYIWIYWNKNKFFKRDSFFEYVKYFWVTYQIANIWFNQLLNHKFLIEIYNWVYCLNDALSLNYKIEYEDIEKLWELILENSEISWINSLIRTNLFISSRYKNSYLFLNNKLNKNFQVTIEKEWKTFYIKFKKWVLSKNIEEKYRFIQKYFDSIEFEESYLEDNKINYNLIFWWKEKEKVHEILSNYNDFTKNYFEFIEKDFLLINYWIYEWIDKQ